MRIYRGAIFALEWGTEKFSASGISGDQKSHQAVTVGAMAVVKTMVGVSALALPVQEADFDIYSRECFKISNAANLPDAAMTPPPGWVQAPHM